MTASLADFQAATGALEAFFVPQDQWLGFMAETKELTETLGLLDFKTVLIEGPERSLYIAATTPGILLAVIFDKAIPIGRIRYEAAKLTVAPEDVSLPQFREFARGLLDQVFGT